MLKIKRKEVIELVPVVQREIESASGGAQIGRGRERERLRALFVTSETTAITRSSSGSRAIASVVQEAGRANEKTEPAREIFQS